VDVAQAVVAGVAAAELQLRLPRNHVELVVGHQDFLGWILKNLASAATDLPDRFMKVCGSSSHRVWPWIVVRATRPW